MFAAPGQRDAQREQLSTAGWRRLKAALFLARPRRRVGCHRKPPGQRCLCPQARGTRQTWIPPTFFRAKQPESLCTGSQALLKSHNPLKTRKRRNARPSRKLWGGLTGIRLRNVEGSAEMFPTSSTAPLDTPRCGGLLPHHLLLFSTSQTSGFSQPCTSTPGLDPSLGVEPSPNGIAGTTKHQQPHAQPWGAAGLGGERKAGGKRRGGNSALPCCHCQICFGFAKRTLNKIGQGLLLFRQE